MSGTEKENDRAVLAGEYVLGLLDEATARAVAAQAESDPVLAREIAAWRDRLDPLADMAPPSAPSDLLWRRIAADLPPAKTEAPPPGPWRALALASLAIAAGLALFLWFGPLDKSEAPWARAVALLAAPGSVQAALRAQVTNGGSITIVPLTQMRVAAGHHMGFWAWPKDHTAPVLLGTLPAQGGQLRYPFAVQDGTPVMVTSEPDSGSAAGPGPTLFLGLLVATS